MNHQKFNTGEAMEMNFVFLQLTHRDLCIQRRIHEALEELRMLTKEWKDGDPSIPPPSAAVNAMLIVMEPLMSADFSEELTRYARQHLGTWTDTYFVMPNDINGKTSMVADYLMTHMTWDDEKGLVIPPVPAPPRQKKTD